MFVFQIVVNCKIKLSDEMNQFLCLFNTKEAVISGQK